MIDAMDPALRRKVFISYSHDDARWLVRVREQLAVLEGEQLIELFDDGQIGVGADWFERLATELRGARLAVLLVSASFLNSEFIRREEVPRLLGEQQRAGLQLVPLLLRDCAWQEVPWLARLQLRPRNAQPLARLKGSALDRALADIARELAALARQTPAAARPEDKAESTVTHGHAWDTTVRWASTRPDWDTESLHRAEHELSKFIGPMAKVMVRHACGKSKNLAALHRALALHIPDAEQRDRFLGAVAPRPFAPAAALPMPPVPLADKAPAVTLAEPLLAHARAVLARHIGPIAGVLLKKLLLQATTKEELFELLAANVEAGPERARLLAELQQER